MPHITNFRLTVFAAFPLALLIATVGYQRYATHRVWQRTQAARPVEKALPQHILWVWDRPEDLHTADLASNGVAVLQQTIRLSERMTVVRRHQPTLLPANVQTIAVVRIETSPRFAVHHNDSTIDHDALTSLLRVARQPGVAALQIDFDARRSEREFYRKLLTQLRVAMPPILPLEITALVSWCSTDDWIADLPVSAAIPMFFRMEPDRRRLVLTASPAYRIREPLCQTSRGVSTTEPWPDDTAGKRLYIFPDHGWSHDLQLLNATETLSAHQ